LNGYDNVYGKEGGDNTAEKGKGAIRMDADGKK
jgi:hypothetical protein